MKKTNFGAFGLIEKEARKVVWRLTLKLCHEPRRTLISRDMVMTWTLPSFFLSGQPRLKGNAESYSKSEGV